MRASNSPGGTPEATTGLSLRIQASVRRKMRRVHAFYPTYWADGPKVDGQGLSVQNADVRAGLDLPVSVFMLARGQGCATSISFRQVTDRRDCRNGEGS